MTRLRGVLLVASAAAVTACEWNPPSHDLNGTWRFRFDDVHGSGVTCSVAQMDVAIRQSGSALTGTQVGTATRRCIAENGDSTVLSFDSDSLQGTLGRLNVAFSFTRTPGSTVAWSPNGHSGEVSGNVMLGTATWGSTSQSLVGTFAAFRLPE